MNTENQNSIIPFLFEENLVRTMSHGALILFAAPDACQILGVINNRDALASLDDDEKITVGNPDGNPRAGIPHQMTWVTEPGLYRLIFKSRKPQARAFQRFVFHEVIPSIRRTGSYDRGHRAYLGLIEDQIRLGVSPDLAAKMAGKLTPAAPAAPKLTELKKLEREERETQLDMLLDVMEPNQTYTIERLLELLPRKNPFRKLTEQGRASAIGKLMEHARRDGRIHRIPNARKAIYQLPSIVKFSTDS